MIHGLDRMLYILLYACWSWWNIKPLTLLYACRSWWNIVPPQFYSWKHTGSIPSCMVDHVVFIEIIRSCIEVLLIAMIWYIFIPLTLVDWNIYAFNPAYSSIRTSRMDAIGNDIGYLTSNPTSLGGEGVLLCTGWDGEWFTASWALVSLIKLCHAASKQIHKSSIHRLSS